MHAHIFALFYEHLSRVPARATTLEITDQTLMHRIKRVLRLRDGDMLVLFDAQVHTQGTLTTLGDRALTFAIGERIPNQALKPELTVALGLLKPDALHTAIYALAELGVNTIQLYTSSKTHRTWGGQKELQRLQRVAVAGAEQSKHFAMPDIKEPIALEDLCAQPADIKIVCEPDGAPLLDYLGTHKPLNNKTITLVVGPEGDLTDDEKKLLHAAHYTPCKLTATVLRSEQAAMLAAGIVRCKHGNHYS